MSLAVLAAALAAWSVGWGPAKRVKVVAVVNHGAVAEPALEGLRQGLAERGWRENDTIRFVYDGPEPSPARLRARARDHVDRGADLVVALSTPAALAAREPTEAAGVPLLLAPASDPVASGLVTSLTHPGQSITGVTFALQEPRRLEWLVRLAPATRAVWVPYNYSDPSPAATLPRLRDAAAKLGITLVTTDIRSVAELKAALSGFPAVDAIFLPADAFIASQAGSILAAARERRLPVTVPHREGVAHGALFSYGFDLTAAGRQAARLADRILSGTPAADLPIEAAEMGLSINIATADHLGLAIPDDVLRHAVVLGRPGG